MTSPPVVQPVQPEFHPEFGYLWPAEHTRRIMRIGLLSTAFGAVVGAIAAIAMTHRGDPDATRAQAKEPRTVGAAPAATAAAAVTAVTPTVAADPGVAAKNQAPSASVENAPKPVTVAPSPDASPAAAATSCKEQTWPYLDSKCIKSNARKRQQVRVLKPETPPQSAPAEGVPAAAPGHSSETTAAGKPSESRKVSKARERKITQSRQRRRDREVAETDRRRDDTDRHRDDADRGRYSDPRRYEPRSAYASPYEPRYEVRGVWGW